MEEINIKTAIKEIFDFVNAYVKAKSAESPGGEKVTLVEKFKLGLEGFDVARVGIGWQKLAADWRSRDSEKVEAWKQAFKENFDIPDDEVELVIEELVSKGLDFFTSLESAATRYMPK